MVVRGAIGAALPLAGTGFAVRTTLLEKIAARRGGDPFDARSLTEDYELGLGLARLGARGCFARVRDAAGGLVAVRAIFPGELGPAVRQKARWMTGIAVAYLAMIAWSVAGAAHILRGTSAAPLPGWMVTLLWINTALLAWRLLLRALFTGRAYGWREALVSPVRFIVGIAVDLLAAPRALLAYLRQLRGGPPVWHKTAHQFPAPETAP
jgi:bacteriophage N4 adsorption protein B